MKEKIAVAGSGFIGSGLARSIIRDPNLELSGVLTRRNINELSLDKDVYTNSPERLFENSDLLVVSVGDPIYATEVIRLAFDYNLPVITMDSETQITSGSWLVNKGFLSEAEGDQPGSLAALDEEVRTMGFTPVIYGNIKGYLNHNPTLEDMTYWSQKNGISLDQVTSFTDGTKINIEQCLVANGLGAKFPKGQMIGVEAENLDEGVKVLTREIDRLGSQTTISDYVLSRNAPAGVFIVAKHSEEEAQSLKYYKLGDGPYYLLTKPYHLCHLEILKTIKKYFKGDLTLFNNSNNPKYSVSGIAKHDLKKGTIIKRGIGSFDVRGQITQIKSNQTHIPIGLMFNMELKQDIMEGEEITFDKVDLPESSALMAWQEVSKLVNEQ